MRRTEKDFQVFLSRRSDGQLSLRCQVRVGHGIFVLPGLPEPKPASVTETHDIPSDALHSGRFIHVMGGGKRQSYAMSRVTADTVGTMPDNQYVELVPITEFGFRYLTVPAQPVPSRDTPQPVASRKDSGPPGGADNPAHTASAAALEAMARFSAGPSASDAPASAAVDLPPAPMPIAPAIAEAALGGLTRDQILTHLRTEMAKTATLAQRVRDLEAGLRRSHARERDLIGVIAGWQGRMMDEA
jgi:hypothetical protein